MRRLFWYIAVLALAWLLAQALMRSMPAEADGPGLALAPTRTVWPSWTPKPTATLRGAQGRLPTPTRTVTVTKWPTHPKSLTPSPKAPTRTPTPTMPECGAWDPTWAERYAILTEAWLACGVYEDDADAITNDPTLVVGIFDFELGGPLGRAGTWRAGEVVIRPFALGVLVWRVRCPRMFAIAWSGETLD